MVFIWRGAGIIVPIIVLIAGWIVSYWFEDTRLGNNVYLGWTFFWASIPLLLLGLAFLGMNATDPETGEKPQKSHHDFFFIPVWIWAVALLGFGIYWINKEPRSGYNYSSEVTVDDEDDDYVASEYYAMRVNFFNTLDDSTHLVVEDVTTEEIANTDIAAYSVKYLDLDKGSFKIIQGGGSKWIDVPGSLDNDDYQEAWFALGEPMDLIVVEVTNVCNDTVTRTDITDINWEELVLTRMRCNDLMYYTIRSEKGTRITMIDPYRNLPLEHAESEKVYALIPIEPKKPTSEEFLDQAIEEVCF